MKCLEILEREKVQDAIWERGTRFLERLGRIVDASGVPVTKCGIPPMPFLTFDHADEHYKERRKEFYTQCIRRGLFVQPYHHWYIAYRHTEADLSRALEVVEESLAYVAEKSSLAAAERGAGSREGASMDKLIITVAGVGAETTKEAQPALPVTAEEIGVDAARCREAGASMYHLHVRDAGRQPDAGQGGLRGRHRRDPQAHRHHHPDLDRRRHGHDRRRAPAAARARPRDGLAHDRHGQLRRRRVLQRHGADDRVLHAHAEEGRAAGVRDLRGRPDRQRPQAGEEVRPGRPAPALGLRARRAGQHERRAAQPDVPGRSRAAGLHVDLHRHRPLAHAGDDDRTGTGRQRAPGLRGQCLLPQGSAGEEQRRAGRSRRAPGRRVGSRDGDAGRGSAILKLAPYDK